VLGMLGAQLAMAQQLDVERSEELELAHRAASGSARGTVIRRSLEGHSTSQPK
jgi:hypothetical protein